MLPLSSFGTPAGQAATPAIIERDATSPWPLADALGALRTVEVDLTPILHDQACGPYEEPPVRGFVIPIVVPAAERPPAAIITGASSRLPLNADYRSFYDLVGVTISGALATVRAREDERRRAESLAEIDRAKTLFFSNVSHEFRTPLTLMLGPLEDALAGINLPPVERDRLTVSHRNALRLLKLVNSLLDFSRIEAGRAQAVYEPTDLATATSELASVFRSAVEKAGLQLIVDCPALSEPAYVDRDMWEKIVLNLISNAFKFTFEGQIEVRLRNTGDSFELAVRDTGTGIPSAELPKVFERFHRVAGAHGRTHEGSGIGLALVQELVKLHGGCVSVESDYGRGSTFKIAIPLGRNHLPAKQIGAARTQASTALGARTFLEEALRWLPNADLQRERLIEDIAVPDPAGTSPNERACILLADDNADMRDYVQRLLASRYEVVAVADGEAALAAVACRKPDLVLTDIMMPRVDGMELLARLRSNAQTSTLPIIMLSARAGEESRVEGLHAGADDYLIKPFSARELLARVEAHVKMARFSHEASAALRGSEARFRHMADHAPVMIWVTEPNGSCTFLNKSWYDFTGERAEASLGFGWFEATHPDDRASACNTFLVANSKREPFRLEYRLRRKDGEYRWTINAAAPHFGETGNFLGYIGSIIDISERNRAEETQQLLVNELSHRVKNTLASVAVVARRTSEKNGSAEDFIETLDRRIHSMADAHELLSRQRWQEVSLADLVNRELAPYTTAGNTVVEGPHVGLPAAETQAMAMVLHELATNAAKYGALSTPNGRVLVRWHSPSNGGASAKLRLEWREDGGPPVTAPVQSGYGTSVIRDLIPYELGGTVELEFRLDGVRCRIEIAVECDVGLAILRTASDALQSMGDHDPHR